MFWTFTPKIKADSCVPYWNIVTLQCVFSSVLPPAAVIWRSCITIFSLKTALRSPSSYKKEIYWELPQNYIIWIVFKLWFLFMSPAVAWLLCFDFIHPSHPENLLPGACHLHTQLHSPWQLPHKPAPDLFPAPSKAVGFPRGCPQSGGRPLPQFTQEPLNFSSSKLSDQSGCVRKYMFHITFSSTLISETETQIIQSSWKRNPFFKLSTFIVQFLICLAISWRWPKVFVSQVVNNISLHSPSTFHPGRWNHVAAVNKKYLAMPTEDISNNSQHSSNT